MSELVHTFFHGADDNVVFSYYFSVNATKIDTIFSS